MIPLSDENPTVHTPYMNYILLGATLATWIAIQGAGFQDLKLAVSVCELGMVPGELTRQSPLGTAVPIADGLVCAVDNQPVNWFTPITSMFLHGGWGHLLGNALFLWVFGNNIEDVMGHWRFLAFYLLCGLAAAGAHVLLDPTSPVPTVGASGAISGVMGAYLVLYPRVRVRMLFIFVIFFKVFRIPAWLVLIWWFGLQLLTGLPQLSEVNPEVTGGVAVWAHIGGFVAGALLIKLFVDRELHRRRVALGDARATFDR